MEVRKSKSNRQDKTELITKESEINNNSVENEVVYDLRNRKILAPKLNKNKIKNESLSNKEKLVDKVDEINKQNIKTVKINEDNNEEIKINLSENESNNLEKLESSMETPKEVENFQSKPIYADNKENINEEDKFLSRDLHMKDSMDAAEINITNSKATLEGNTKTELSQINLKEGVTRSVRHPKIASNKNFVPYNVANDLLNLKCNINLAQLIDVAPKVRSELSNCIKFNKNAITSSMDFSDKTENSLENNSELKPKSSKSFSNNDLGLVKASVDGKDARLLVDTGSNLNIVTSSFLNKLPFSYQHVGPCNGSIFEALGNRATANSYYIRLNVHLGSISFTADFCVVSNENAYFDLLIGMKTIGDNGLFIHPYNASVYQMHKDDTFINIAPLVEQDCPEAIACFIRFVGYDKVASSLNHTQDPVDSDEEFFSSIPDMEEEEYISPEEYLQTKEFLSSLNPDYCDEVLIILSENLDCIAVTAMDLAPSDLGPHHIQLVEGAAPFKSRFYRLNKVKSDIVKNELGKLFKKNLIKHAKSSWSSPIVLVKKKGKNQWRLCVDFRKLNALTVPDVYALPDIWEIFDCLGGAIIFTTLDLFAGYHQILMDEESVNLTCFTTKFGNFVYKVMPFGLTGAPATFQREMNRILFDLLGKCVFVFLDDILIFSRSVEEHIVHLNQVLAIFRMHKVKINIKKCSFFKEEVEVLGHVVSKDGLKTMKSKTQAVEDWVQPKDVSELRSFLGSVGYYRKFIKNFSALAAPLNKLLRKNIVYIWAEEQENSFNKLKQALVNAPVLVFPDYSKQFIIRTDACYEGIGGVLLQINDQDKLEHPIHFVSRTLTKAERNYSITDLEGTAVFYCARQFKSYISGNKYETLLYTDHKPLVGLFGNKEPNNARHIRWCITISMLRIKILYEPGKRNALADALSRLNLQENKILKIEDKTNPMENKMDAMDSDKKNKNLHLVNFSKFNLENFKNFKILEIQNKNFEIEKLKEIHGYIENFEKSNLIEIFNICGNTEINLNYYMDYIWDNKLKIYLIHILSNFDNLCANTTVNTHILEINRNKLNKFMNLLKKWKLDIIKYYTNKLANIKANILQYNEENENMLEKHKINELSDIENQYNQTYYNLLEYIDNIQNSIDSSTEQYRINAINNINSDSTAELDESGLLDFMKKFIDDHIIEENGNKYIKTDGKYRKIIETQEEKFNLILKAHSIAHEGFEKTYQRLRATCYWKGMTTDIRRFIKGCTVCQMNKKDEIPEPTEKYATKVEGPFVHLGLDIVGPLPVTSRDNRYIIVVVDYFTKWVEAEPSPTVNHNDIIYFFSRFFARHGIPQSVTADNGVQFTADYTKIFLDMYDVYITFTTTYHPESNGMTENRNKEINKLLRTLATRDKEWDLTLPFALWALRTAKSTATKYSSFELLYGRKDLQPFELATRLPTSYVQQSEEELLVEKFVDHYKWVRSACENLKKNKEFWENKRREDTLRNKQNEIKVGDLVKVRNFTRHKLDPYFVGPFKVVKKGFNTVVLADPNTNLEFDRPIHLKNIIKFHTTTMP